MIYLFELFVLVAYTLKSFVKFFNCLWFQVIARHIYPLHFTILKFMHMHTSRNSPYIKFVHSLFLFILLDKISKVCYF